VAGKNVTIAVIDSGISNHPDLYPHGTHVAWIAGGTGKRSADTQYTRKVREIAPDVKFVNLVVLWTGTGGRQTAW
jgi:subtilisin family serine protease